MGRALVENIDIDNDPGVDHDCSGWEPNLKSKMATQFVDWIEHMRSDNRYSTPSFC